MQSALGDHTSVGEGDDACSGPGPRVVVDDNARSVRQCRDMCSNASLARLVEHRGGFVEEQQRAREATARAQRKERRRKVDEEWKAKKEKQSSQTLPPQLLRQQQREQQQQQQEQQQQQSALAEAPAPAATGVAMEQTGDSDGRTDAL